MINLKKFCFNSLNELKLLKKTYSLNDSSDLSQNLKEILIGVLLGDAYIHKTKFSTTYITFEQSINKIDIGVLIS